MPAGWQRHEGGAAGKSKEIRRQTYHTASSRQGNSFRFFTFMVCGPLGSRQGITSHFLHKSPIVSIRITPRFVGVSRIDHWEFYFAEVYQTDAKAFGKIFSPAACDARKKEFAQS